jgi:predicted nucleic acid-binding protein
MVADRVWELRHSLTAYDGTFVALAELLDAPLITFDGRLSLASGHSATVELFLGS